MADNRRRRASEWGSIIALGVAIALGCWLWAVAAEAGIETCTKCACEFRVRTVQCCVSPPPANEEGTVAQAEPSPSPEPIEAVLHERASDTAASALGFNDQVADPPARTEAGRRPAL